MERSTAVLSQHGAVVKVEVELSDSKENSKEGAGQEREMATDDGHQVRVIYGTTKRNENPYFICIFISKQARVIYGFTGPQIVMSTQNKFVFIIVAGK